MSIYDWTRVRANRFHDFHQTWTVAICDALNTSQLPSGYFAMIEQKVRRPKLESLALEMTPPVGLETGGMSIDATPPQTQFVFRTEAELYARKANRITIRHPDGDIVAILEIVSPGNKSSRHAIQAFARKMVELLHAGIHLLIVDLFPPSRRDPQGIHKVIWDRLCDEPFTLPPEKPLTIAAYAAGTELVAYVEPVAVGDPLPEMPIFLTASRYVPCPLESTYQTAWQQFPAPLKKPLESGPTG